MYQTKTKHFISKLLSRPIDSLVAFSSCVILGQGTLPWSSLRYPPGKNFPLSAESGWHRWQWGSTNGVPAWLPLSSMNSSFFCSLGTLRKRPFPKPTHFCCCPKCITFSRQILRLLSECLRKCYKSLLWKTSKTKVLQLPSAIDVNQGWGARK